MAISVFIGCSGWYYFPHWKGKFYPEELPTSKWFSYYTAKFNAVELNSSFYRIPKLQNVKTWVRNVKLIPPESFKYSVKMSKSITHEARLDLKACEGYMKEFFSAIAFLKGYLGAILLQFPPSFKQSDENMQKLVGFKAWIEKARDLALFEGIDLGAIPFVVEFRHSSWFQESVIAAIQDAGLVFAVIDTPARAKLPVIYTGRDVMYLRLHGHDPVKWYRYNYTDVELKTIKNSINEIARNSGTKAVYVFFDNDYGANAPVNAITLMNLINSNDG
nr:DUF72 domain-containing protein [Candidatus Sigynarchaeota archaeon]